MHTVGKHHMVFISHSLIESRFGKAIFKQIKSRRRRKKNIKKRRMGMRKIMMRVRLGKGKDKENEKKKEDVRRTIRKRKLRKQMRVKS